MSQGTGSISQVTFFGVISNLLCGTKRFVNVSIIFLFYKASIVIDSL